MSQSSATTGRGDPARPAERQFGGGSFAVRLMVLSLVPILGFAWLSVIRLKDLGDSVDDAEQLARSAQLHRNLNAAAQHSHSERLSLSALALADEMAVPRPLIEALSGMDLEKMYYEASSDLDAELDELDTRLIDLDPYLGAELQRRLADARSQLSEQRDLSAELRADRNQLSEIFDLIDSVASDAYQLSAAKSTGRALVITAEVRMGALRDVILSANTYGTAIMDSLVSSNDLTEARVERRLAIHQAQLNHLENVAAEEDKADVRALRKQFDATIPEVQSVVGDVEIVASPDLATVTAAAEPLVGVFDYIGVLGVYSEQTQEAVVADAEAAAAATRVDARNTQIVMYTVGALTIALIIFVAVSTVAPLRRLGRRAEAIGEGELALEPLPIRGPGIIRTLTATVNEMLTTLHRVDQEINGLASGDFGIDSNDIPGTIGESLRSSVDHLARVTAQWQRSESFASAIVEQAADAIWAVDSGGVIRTANAASERLLEIDVDRQLGRSIYEFLPILSGETVVKGRPGVRVHVASNSVTDSDLPVTVIARDVSERARFEERLAHQARHDALTDLPNRFAVLERLEQLHERQESVAVLFIDIDGFKSVNDTRGHEAGDRVLTEIGRRLRSHVRPYDFVARLGGDEFVVLVRDIRRTAEALPFGERVIQQIEQPIVDDHSMFTLSASVGIALTDEALPALEAIRRADSAVYLAKRHGRGRVEVYDAALQASIEHDAELELALRHAIRSDELVLHYQPIVDLRTGEMCGVEALVRWERPGFGLIPPGDFVPVAERSSLIVDMQHWVLEEACATLASWHERDPYSTHTVAVNISGRHLIDGDLVGDLHQALDRTGADPGLLVFELTETHLLEDVDRATAVLNEIRRFGITISVDDFGTGYSSMTYLRDLPIDVIKIDRSFLAAAVREGRDEPLVDAMLTIGRNLHLKVVAEGVETERQLAYITERGCDYAQGWLFARAVPIDEAEAMLFGSSTPVLQPVAGA